MVDPSAFATANHPPSADLAPLFWHQITRLGEAQLLLPALLLMALWLARRPGGGRLAAVWLAGTAVATVLTTASKVAFIGYGWGWAPLDFTGISGHAMFAAAVLPLLVRLGGGALLGHHPPTPLLPGRHQPAAPVPGRHHQRGLLVLGYALAGAVAVSRVMVNAHSWSEVIAGFALGALCSGLALWLAPLPALRLARWAPALLVVWALTGVVAAPPPTTHDLVTRLALAQSGRVQPYHRWEMHRDHSRRQLRPASPVAGGAPATANAVNTGNTAIRSATGVGSELERFSGATEQRARKASGPG